MKKIYIGAIIAMFLATANATLTYTENPIYVSGTVSNAITPWFGIKEQNVGVGIEATAGSCTLEFAVQPISVCNATACKVFIEDTLTFGGVDQKKFNLLAGAGSVRVNCTSGTADFYIRK